MAVGPQICTSSIDVHLACQKAQTCRIRALSKMRFGMWHGCEASDPVPSMSTRHAPRLKSVTYRHDINACVHVHSRRHATVLEGCMMPILAGRRSACTRAVARACTSLPWQRHGCQTCWKVPLQCAWTNLPAIPGSCTDHVCPGMPMMLAAGKHHHDVV